MTEWTDVIEHVGPERWVWTDDGSDPIYDILMDYFGCRIKHVKFERWRVDGVVYYTWSLLRKIRAAPVPHRVLAALAEHTWGKDFSESEDGFFIRGKRVDPRQLLGDTADCMEFG